jgi:hypothetical protein
MRLVALAALFAAGMLLAVGLDVSGAADAFTTTTETLTTTTTVPETTTAPGTTVVTTETVQQTATRQVIVPTSGTTTSGSGESSDIPTWVWVVLAILAVGVVGLAIALMTRRGGGMPPAERRRRLDHAVATWVAQGWALESQTGDSAVLRRDRELMLVNVDEAGQVNTRPLAR